VLALFSKIMSLISKGWQLFGILLAGGAGA